MKNLGKALFIGQNVAEIYRFYKKPEDYVGLTTYEDWYQTYFDQLI